LGRPGKDPDLADTNQGGASALVLIHAFSMEPAADEGGREGCPFIFIIAIRATRLQRLVAAKGQSPV